MAEISASCSPWSRAAKNPSKTKPALAALKLVMTALRASKIIKEEMIRRGEVILF